MGNLNTALWVVQVILAIKFATTAYSHLFQTGRPVWRAGMEKMGARAKPMLVVSSVFSALGAVGLIVPAATGILPWLTPLAAALLALLMVRGIVFHLGCRGRPNLAAGVVLVVLALFVAYGRWVLVPL